MLNQPFVLVVAPLSGHHATLLRDTVRTLLRDHRVYVTDWVDARMVPSSEAPARGERVPADRAGAGRGFADGQPWRTDAAHAGDDGRPDRCALQPDCSEQPGHAEPAVVVREQRHPHRAAQLPRRRSPRVSGLPAACRLPVDEPQPPFQLALGFLHRPGQGRPGRRRRAPSFL
ncbi:hypothetical protein G6F66_014107 [Rhizopus arrhizus]|nr:hypothetical protein G6F66_014107 [Rhizopus arrhizus]